MELKVIEQLLEKYLEAETSLEEETQLRSYFSSGEIAPHLQEYAPIFGFFEAAKEESYSGTEKFSKILQQAEASDARQPAGKADRKRVFSWVAVAASIVIMAGVFLQESPQINEFGSYEDPQIALEETRKALDMVSELMNSGNDNLGYLKEFDNTKNKLIK